MKILIRSVLLIFFTTIILNAQNEPQKGILKGSLTDGDSKTGLIGANVTILNTTMGAATDLDGNFDIVNIPVGSYSVRFSYIGYESVTKTDIIIRPGRITFLDAELKADALVTDSIVVTSGYFKNSDIQPNGLTSFSYEEIRRAPGSAGDISRTLMSLPGIAKINDQSNSLIVRGGSPIENVFYIDNIEIPNINHFPMIGSSGGPIGLVNVDFIKEVDFYSGGFGARYGDRLSSVMDIKFREGNRERYDYQLDASFQALGGIIEGPINEGRGSWFMSARKSYLDIIFESVAPGEAMPDYSDFHVKVNYDISKYLKLSVLDIYSRDRQTMTYKKAAENNKNDFFDIKVDMNTSGLNCLYIWPKAGYSNFTFSHLYWNDDKDFSETRTKKLRNLFETNEQEFRFNNFNHFKLNNEHRFDFGLEAKYIFNKYDNYYADRIDPLGQQTQALQIKRDIKSIKTAGFLNYIFESETGLLINPGIRISYFDFNKNIHMEPRFALTYKMNETTSFTASYGIYFQQIPAIFLAQNKQFDELNDPRSQHYVISLNYLLTEDTKLTFEVYDKEYDNLPMDPEQPQLMLFDEAIFNSSFNSHAKLVSSGKAYSRGAEISVQKKLAENFYGLISGTYYRTKYEDLSGKVRNRIFDNKFSFNLEGGYKPNKSWEFSARWIYAGGAPYTPFDLSASKAAFSGVYDQGRINGVRLPDYHSLNIRFDRRFNFTSSSLVVYFSVWNAYGRKNLYAYSWNEMTNEQQEEKQWTTIPVMGLEFEF